jgi:hypothetical protein
LAVKQASSSFITLTVSPSPPQPLYPCTPAYTINHFEDADESTSNVPSLSEMQHCLPNIKMRSFNVKTFFVLEFYATCIKQKYITPPQV